MNKKCILFGLGMIGELHAKILNQKFGYAVFSYNSKGASEYIVSNLNSEDEIVKLNPDFIIISNETSRHLETLKSCLKFQKPIFIEKPVAHNINDFVLLENELKNYPHALYVAYCLRFNPVVKYINEFLKNNKPVNIEIRNSNNLSCWPRSNGMGYSKSFSQGGGIVLDLSHEIDYLNYLSPIQQIKYHYVNKNSDLTNDAADYMFAFFETEHSPASIILNYHGHLKERFIKIDFKDYTLFGDLRELRIDKYEKLVLIDQIKFEGEFNDMYIQQWDYFLSNLSNPKLMNNIFEAKNVLNVICTINKEC